MVSKSKIKFVNSLQIKKYRYSEQCFIVQGHKTILETIQSDYQIVELFGTKEFISSIEILLNERSLKDVSIVSERELISLGSIESNQSGLAVVKMKPPVPYFEPAIGYTLVLDKIRDPGNLGSIIRTADWFGIKEIIASPSVVDMYNPKVINATMGSFLRINILYTSLPEFLANRTLPIYGAFLNGENVHSYQFKKAGFIIFGNESQGISPDLHKFISHRISIPRVGKAESLNVAQATAIVLDNLRRQGS